MITIVGAKGEGKKLVYRQEDGRNHVVLVRQDGQRTIVLEGRPASKERPAIRLS